MKLKRLTAIALAVFMTVTSLPVSSMQAYAVEPDNEVVEDTDAIMNTSSESDITDEASGTVESEQAEDQSAVEDEQPKESGTADDELVVEDISDEESFFVDGLDQEQEQVVGEVAEEKPELLGGESILDLDNEMECKLKDSDKYPGYIKLTLTGGLTGLKEIKSEDWLANKEESPRPAYDWSKIAEVEIEDGVTTIGQDAFNYSTGFTNLKEITLPASVTTIGSSAFSETGLTSVTITEGTGDPITFNIGGNAFKDCTYLEKIEFPKSISCVGIEYRAFYGSGLTDITFEHPKATIEIPTAAVSDAFPAGTVFHAYDYELEDQSPEGATLACSVKSFVASY